MDLWSAVGTLWDQASDGEAGLAAARASHLLNSTDDDVERVFLLAERALCEVLLCRYVDATRSSLAAAISAQSLTGDLADDARYFAQSVRLVAAGMIEPELSGVDSTLAFAPLAELQEYARQLDRERPEVLLLLFPVVEASMAAGRFHEVENLVAPRLPYRESDGAYSAVIVLFLELLVARSLAFRGEIAAMEYRCRALLALPAIAAHPQAAMLTDALLCYGAGQRSDRHDVETRGAEVLAEARRSVNYVTVGSCLLVTWAFSAIGQVQRASSLLLASSGGPLLPRIKTWDKSFGYELLVTAALRRGDLPAARDWATLAAPLAAQPVATAAVERTLARLAVADGDNEDAASRATESARLDAESGAKLEHLRSRVLHATALAAAGRRQQAIRMLADIAELADAIGATAVRKLAAREWRLLAATDSSADGGFASLSDREREIAILVAEGHTNRSIGSTLFLSERTVQTHLSRILNVMQLPSRTAIPAALGVGTDAVETPPLTERQQQIAELVSRGHGNARIAEELGISIKTVENHLAGIFARWQVASRTAVANLWVASQRTPAR
ncbi:MAG TPA: LuxR C-terminal-related transcriptional regulator [Galbitalea sp.]|jgi:DNA-binding NarL/FixJ family response regulator